MPILEPMPTGCCQHAGRYSFPKHQTTKFMHEKILISYLVLVKEYKACCPGCGGCLVVFFFNSLYNRLLSVLLEKTFSIF